MKSAAHGSSMSPSNTGDEVVVVLNNLGGGTLLEEAEVGGGDRVRVFRRPKSPDGVPVSLGVGHGVIQARACIRDSGTKVGLLLLSTFLERFDISLP